MLCREAYLNQRVYMHTYIRVCVYIYENIHYRMKPNSFPMLVQTQSREQLFSKEKKIVTSKVNTKTAASRFTPFRQILWQFDLL